MSKMLKLVFSKASRLTLQNTKYLLLLWFTNFALAFALTIPIYSLLRSDLAHSLLNSHFTGEFDYLWFLQFYSLNLRTIEALPGLLISVTVIYNLIQLFYSGGFISVLLNPGKNHWVDFFYGGVKYFYRFLKIFLLALVLYAGALGLNVALHSGVFYLSNRYGSPLLLLGINILRNVLFLFFICSVNLIIDYAKIATCATDETKIRVSFRNALRFIGQNFRISLIVYLLCGTLVVAAALTYNAIDSFLPKSTITLILLTFFFQQLLVIFRLIIKILFFSTEVVLYSELSADIISAEAEELVSGA